MKGKFMQVSFGMVYPSTEKGLKYATGEQFRVGKEVEKAFESHSDEYFKRGDVKNFNRQPTTVSDLLKNEANCDVCVLSKKDGNVELQLMEGYGQYYYDVMTDENDKPVSTILDLSKPMENIKKQIKQFGVTCIKFVKTGLDKKNLKAFKTPGYRERIIQFLEDKRIDNELNGERYY